MAEIFINRQTWEQLSTEEQQSVEDILREEGALSEGDMLTPSDDVPEMLFPTIGFLRGQLGEEETGGGIIAANEACRRACDAAYGVLVTRCNLLPLPQARAVCFGAATVTYGACLASC